MKRPLLLVMVSLAATACREASLPTATLAPPVSVAQAAIGSAAHFFWLPPIVAAPASSGRFDPSVSPVVRISEWSAGEGALVAEFVMAPGSGSEVVRLDAEGEFYVVNWHTRRFNLDPARNYRIRVLVDGSTLGFADVDVVSSGSDLKNVDIANFVPVLNGRTLPIKFRIEQRPAPSASLTLSKSVVNDDGGTATAADFTLSAEGPTPISGTGTASSGSGFQPGTYTLSETGPAGYSASAWTCTGGTLVGNQLTLAAGDAAACAITNYDVGLTSVQLVSDAGDFIGQGKSYGYTLANSVITVSAGGGHFGIAVRGDEVWNGDFQVPSALTSLATGTYTNLGRYPFGGAAGGLNWSGEGRGCGSLAGSFTINRATYVNGVLTDIELTFEQRCGNATAALRGEIHWSANDPTLPPDPVFPVPAGLWQPAAGATPASGNYVYLRSDAGDYIGQGQTNTYAAFSVSASQNRVTVSVSGTWTGNFQAMYTLTQLQEGYYPDVRRYPFHNPARGGLDWSGSGRGCNKLLGWIAVDRITYSGGLITGLDLRFEQHCEGLAPALHGAIHWNAP